MIPSHIGFRRHSFAKTPSGSSAEGAGLTLPLAVCEAMRAIGIGGIGEGLFGMNFKWLGPLVLLAALVIGDQIRINRPGHKYRLTVEVETPEGVKSASGVIAVHPDRSYSRGGDATPRATPCSSISAAARIWSPCWRISTRKLDLDDINYVALRAYGAAGGKRVLQRHEPDDRHRAGEG